MTRARHSTLSAIANHADDPNAIVEAGEMIDMRFPNGTQMSLRAAKLFHLLVKETGDRIADPIQHRVPLAALNASLHRSAAQLVDMIEELHSTTLSIRLTREDGRPFVKSGPILSDVEREDEELDQAEIRFEFSPALRQAIANSSHWAVISRRAVLAFESKYSLRLYSIFALRANLRHKTSETFDLAELREMLGVPPDRLADWKDFKRRALEPAIAEIDHLAGFYAHFVPVRKGKRIVAVTLTWGIKDDAARADALRELDRPRVGRKARRQGTVEELAESRSAIAEALAAAPGRALGVQ